MSSNYPCTAEQQEYRYTFVHVQNYDCFAWDGSTSILRLSQQSAFLDLLFSDSLFFTTLPCCAALAACVHTVGSKTSKLLSFEQIIFLCVSKSGAPIGTNFVGSSPGFLVNEDHYKPSALVAIIQNLWLKTNPGTELKGANLPASVV